MKIYEFERNIKCDECGKVKNVNKIVLRQLEYDVNYLCDKCMQELNRKIVEHLADKHI